MKPARDSLCVVALLLLVACAPGYAADSEAELIERRAARLKELPGALRQNHRTERTPQLASLFSIDAIPHFDASWVAQDAAVAERPRSQLHSTLEPADDLTLCEQSRNLSMSENSASRRGPPG